MKIKFIGCLLVTILLTSCLEILEEVNVSKNGSGTLTYTINLSQSKSKINSLLLLDSIKGHEIPSENDIVTKINEVMEVIKKTEGITNVSKELNFDDYLFKFSCDFKNIDALNKASSIVKDHYQIKDPHANTDDHFSYDKEKHTFHRKGNYEGEADLDRVDEEDLNLLRDANFTSIYRFEEEVKSCSNPDTKIAPSKKAVMLKYPLIDIITKKKEIENTVFLN